MYCEHPADGQIAIRTTGLSKKYYLYTGRKQKLMHALYGLLGMNWTDGNSLHAIDGVSLTFERGKIYGIVGTNGSGKSTFLQMLAGTSSPTSGRIDIYGRVAALLELGAGFSPEFTGRENAVMTCLLAGMNKKEISKSIDEIIRFADIGQYIDQPVKFYSSGMFVRLAFSAAIHSDPDIFLVDEALAVGDARFQRKCYAKIQSLKESGKTVLFVSHDISAIKEICDEAILMSAGKVIVHSDPQTVAMEYYNRLFPKGGSASSDTTPDKSVEELNPQFGSGGASIVDFKIAGFNSPLFHGGEKTKITLEIALDVGHIEGVLKDNAVSSNLIVGVSISDRKGNYLTGFTTFDKGLPLDLESHKFKVDFNFALPLLKEGEYFLNAAIALGTQENHVQLAWYEPLIMLTCDPQRPYTYGSFYVPYEVSVSPS